MGNTRQFQAPRVCMLTLPDVSARARRNAVHRPRRRPAAAAHSAMHLSRETAPHTRQVRAPGIDLPAGPGVHIQPAQELCIGERDEARSPPGGGVRGRARARDGGFVRTQRTHSVHRARAYIINTLPFHFRPGVRAVLHLRAYIHRALSARCCDSVTRAPAHRRRTYGMVRR